MGGEHESRHCRSDHSPGDAVEYRHADGTAIAPEGHPAQRISPVDSADMFYL